MCGPGAPLMTQGLRTPHLGGRGRQTARVMSTPRRGAQGRGRWAPRRASYRERTFSEPRGHGEKCGERPEVGKSRYPRNLMAPAAM